MPAWKSPKFYSIYKKTRKFIEVKVTVGKTHQAEYILPCYLNFPRKFMKRDSTSIIGDFMTGGGEMGELSLTQAKK